MAEQEDIQAISKFFKIISDSTRLSILYILKEENVALVKLSILLEWNNLLFPINYGY